MAKKTILDTDIGVDIDDSLCLTYLLADPAIEVMGITTVSGESEKRSRMADIICRHMGYCDTPIYPGCETSLTGVPQSNAEQAVQLERWKHRCDFEQGKAFRFMIDTIRANPGEITLIAIGPLTNIAVLFNLDPEIPDLLAELVIMGGWFLEPYTNASQPEWNIKCDPLAAQIVFQRGKRVRCVGLDVTLPLTLNQQKAVDCLEAYHAFQPAREFARVWFAKVHRMTFHDPLAGVVVTDSSCCRFSPGEVEVELSPGPKFGWTYWKPTDNGNVQIGTEVSAETFFQTFFQVIRQADISLRKK